MSPDALERQCTELRERLYELQQHYSAEHFELQQCLRELKTERLRNAGAYAALDATLKRARALQARIADLKQRLQRHETVEDEHFDNAPIRLEK